VPRNDNALPPKPFMRAVFGFNFLYWATIKLFGRNMLRMFVPQSIYKEMSNEQRRSLILEVLLSGLPISKRTKGIMFDTYVSNPSVNEKLAYDKIESPALIVHAIDDPAPPIEGARFISGKIINSELKAFETGGHLILNHEKEIKAAVHDFVFR
jgi:2-hydroxy-6-oxonona-2,4-dienedioate hydrolase